LGWQGGRSQIQPFHYYCLQGRRSRGQFENQLCFFGALNSSRNAANTTDISPQYSNVHKIFWAKEPGLVKVQIAQRRKTMDAVISRFFCFLFISAR
jgi:hypothetical protein